MSVFAVVENAWYFTTEQTCIHSYVAHFWTGLHWSVCCEFCIWKLKKLLCTNFCSCVPCILKRNAACSPFWLVYFPVNQACKYTEQVCLFIPCPFRLSLLLIALIYRFTQVWHWICACYAECTNLSPRTRITFSISFLKSQQWNLFGYKKKMKIAPFVFILDNIEGVFEMQIFLKF